MPVKSFLTTFVDDHLVYFFCKVDFDPFLSIHEVLLGIDSSVSPDEVFKNASL